MLFFFQHNIYHVKSIKCLHNPEILSNVTCRIKATRNGHGLTTVKFNLLRPTNDIWVHLQLFYKYGTLYREWMVNVDIDLCCALDEKCDSGIMINLFMQAVNAIKPNSYKPCPYHQGAYDLVNIDLNELVGKMLPQIFPTGYYKTFITFHNKANSTDFHMELTAYVEAKDFMKSMLIG